MVQVSYGYCPRPGSNVNVDEVVVVTPSQPVKNHTLFLSNFDQGYGYYVMNLLFYKDSPDFNLIVSKLKASLSELLVSYDFWSGRLRFNAQNKLEINCNGAGVLFASATSDLSVSEVTADDFDDFFLSPEAKSLDELPLLTLQVTHLLADNGYAVAVLNQHLLADAASGATFLLNLASIARGDGLYLLPNGDRTAWKARVPPQIKYQHQEFTKHVADLTTSRRTLSAEAILQAVKLRRNAVRTRVRKTYNFSSRVLNQLKSAATGDAKIVSRCSSFEALAAFVWKAHARVLEKRPDVLLKLLFIMDTRQVWEPPLGKNFCGNGQFAVVAEATSEDLRTMSLTNVVVRIQEARKMITDDYLRSAVDYLELHPDHWYRGDTVINSWPRLMSNSFDVDLGWGKPSRVEFPLDPRNKNIIFFPLDSYGSVDGLDVSVGLDPSSVAAFEQHIAGYGYQTK